MALVEIVRFNDVYEAELAAAFLASHGVDVLVAERFQMTVDPMGQRAIGIRLMGAASQADMARDLLARASGGEFANDDGDLIGETPHTRAWTLASILTLFVAVGGVAWGVSRPRRLRIVHVIGLGFLVTLLITSLGLVWLAGSGLLGPSPYL